MFVQLLQTAFQRKALVFVGESSSDPAGHGSYLYEEWTGAAIGHRRGYTWVIGIRWGFLKSYRGPVKLALRKRKEYQPFF